MKRTQFLYALVLHSSTFLQYLANAFLLFIYFFAWDKYKQKKWKIIILGAHYYYFSCPLHYLTKIFNLFTLFAWKWNKIK